MMEPTCLRCGAELSAYTGMTAESITPTTGAVSLCLYCGDLAIFVVEDGTIALREPTDEERAEILTDQVVVDALTARQMAIDGGLT